MARGRTRFIRPPKKTKVWLSIDISVTNIAADVDVLVGVLNAAALLLRPFTILRTHMEMLWISDQVVATEQPMGAFGIIVVNDVAAAVGITGIPTPLSNANSDWFAWQALQNSFTTMMPKAPIGCSVATT